MLSFFTLIAIALWLLCALTGAWDAFTRWMDADDFLPRLCGELENDRLESVDNFRPGKRAGLFLLFCATVCSGSPALALDTPAPGLLPVVAAGNEAPEGLGSFAASGLYVMGGVIAVLQVVSLIRGLKVQQPLHTSEVQKPASDGALSRVATAANQRFDAVAVEFKEVREELHRVDREFAGMVGQQEQHMSDVNKRLDKIEANLERILERLPRK